jgi:hypothetical protein
MMLDSFTGRLWRRRSTGPDSVEHHSPHLGIDSEPALDARSRDWLEHHCAEEHAALLLKWIQNNVELGYGLLFHDALQEFYAEAVNDAGWAAKPWNPVARHLDLICTGGCKPYAWVMTPTGRMKRRRYYPIPKRAELRGVA